MMRISIDDNIEYMILNQITFTDDKIIVELKTFFKKNVDDLYEDFLCIFKIFFSW